MITIFCGYMPYERRCKLQSMSDGYRLFFRNNKTCSHSAVFDYTNTFLVQSSIPSRISSTQKLKLYQRGFVLKRYRFAA